MSEHDPESIHVAVSVHARPEVSGDELAHAVGISAASLRRMIRLGLLEPDTGDAFPATTVFHLRRVLRMRRDLGLDLIGAAVVADLVARIEQLEAELVRLRRRS